MSSLRYFRPVSALAAAVVLSLLPGCGGTENRLDPLLSRVDQARDAQALSSLVQGLTSAGLVRSESGGTYGSGPADLAQRLQERDPSKRFTIQSSVAPEQIQVMGGGAEPAMLVVRSASDAYLAVWLDASGTTLYYRGLAPPQFAADRPAGQGWSSTPPH